MYNMCNVLVIKFSQNATTQTQTTKARQNHTNLFLALNILIVRSIPTFANYDERSHPIIFFLGSALSLWPEL